MKVTIVRHGETEENKKKILQGHLPGELSELGISQAKDVGERLKDKDIDLIISSDLTRTYDTAKEISKFHDGISVKKNELLRERYLGDLQGRVSSSLDIPKGDSFADHVENNNGEGDEDFEERAREILDRIEKKPEEEIVVVSHCGIIRAILGSILDKGSEEMKKMGLDNASITSLEFNDGEWDVVGYNDTEHLE